jgi:hypothetical protein
MEYQNQIVVKATQQLRNRSSHKSAEILTETLTLLTDFFQAHLIGSQLAAFRSSSDKLLNELSKALNTPYSSLKPDIYAKTGRKAKRICLQNPKDADGQFHQELHFGFSQIIYLVADSLRTGNCPIIDKLSPITSLIELIGFSSVKSLLGAWNFHLSHLSRAWGPNVDAELTLNTHLRHVAKRMESMLWSQTAITLKQNLFKLNALRDTEQYQKHQQRTEEQQMEKDARESFEELLSDLRREIERQKAAFRYVYTQYYDTVLRMIQEVIDDPEHFQKAALRNQEERVAQIELESTELRSQIRQMRISRCLEGRATEQVSSRAITKTGTDRQSLNASLWFGRRQFEEETISMEIDMEESYQRLMNAHIEIERLTRQLEKDRRYTTQLMHWRGISFRTYDKMIEQVNDLFAVGNVNIDKLLRKLAEKNDELEELVIETTMFEEQFEHEVREPMAMCDGFKRYIRQYAAESVRDFDEIKHPVMESPFLEKVMRENEDLRRENEELRIRVEEIEKQKAELSPAALRMLDGIFEPAPKDPIFPRRTVPATATKIVRPAQSARKRALRATTVKSG